jgi:hypothetical protein
LSTTTTDRGEPGVVASAGCHQQYTGTAAGEQRCITSAGKERQVIIARPVERRHRAHANGRIAAHFAANRRRNVRSGESASTLTAAGRSVATCPAHCVGGLVGGLVTPAGAALAAPGAFVESVR